MMVSRRQFLVSFAAALAVHRLPRALVNRVPEYAYSAAQATRAANGGRSLWSALYELDPAMLVRVDHERLLIHIVSSYDYEMIRNVLWRLKPIGILATVNGRAVKFDDYIEQMLSA